MGPSASTASAPLSNRQLKARMKQAEKKLEQCSHVNQTPFRSAERNFKSRTPPPDFSNVIYPSSQPVSEQLVPVQLTQDLRMLSPHFGTSDASWEQRSHQAYVLKELPGKSPIYEIEDRHTHVILLGLVIIPNPFTPAAQRHLIQHCLSDYPRSPNTSNLHTHYHIPPTGLWPLYEQEQNGTIPMDDPRHFVAKKHTTNDAEEEEEETKQRTLAIPLKACDDTFKPDMQVTKPDPPAASTVPLLSATDLLRRLRWITLGYHYHWPTRTYHLNRRFPVPDVVTSLAKSVVCAIEQVGHDGVWKNTYSAAQYQPEAGVVNYYQYKDTLMGHVDRSELNMDAPLVSIR